MHGTFAVIGTLIAAGGSNTCAKHRGCRSRIAATGTITVLTCWRIAASRSRAGARAPAPCQSELQSDLNVLFISLPGIVPALSRVLSRESVACEAGRRLLPTARLRGDTRLMSVLAAVSRTGSFRRRHRRRRRLRPGRDPQEPLQAFQIDLIVHFCLFQYFSQDPVACEPGFGTSASM